MAGARTFVFVRRAPAYRDRPAPALRSTMAFWISTAQRTASTTERNSTSAPSPVRPAAVRPCGSAAELIGRRVKLFGLGRIWITRWPRELRRRGRPRRGRFRHAPGGRRSRDGEGRSARLVRYGATTPWRRSAHPTWPCSRWSNSITRAISCLGGRGRCWCGRCAPGRRHICCGLRFRRILVRVLRNGRAGYGLRAALIGRDGLQSRVSQFQRIRLARFLVPSPGFHSRLRFDLRTRPAFRSLVATFCFAAAFRVFGGMRQRSLRCDASNKIARCVSVSLAGELIGIILSVLAALSPSPPRAPNRRRAGRGRRIRRSFHRRVTPAGA